MDTPARQIVKPAIAKGRWLIAVLVGALFWLLPVLVFVNLRHGLDIADTGHYYNTLSQFPDIQSMSSQYFLFWEMLPVGEGIYENRVWVFGLLFFAGAVFSIGVVRFLRLDPWSNPTIFVGVSAMWSSVYFYYVWWLPDPSYNAVAIIFLYTLAGLVLGLTTIPLGRKLLAWSFVTGFILAAFAITRASSAIVFLILATAFYICFANPKLRPILSKKTFVVLMAGFMGGLLFLLLAHIFVEPFATTLKRQLAGLEMRQLRGRNLQTSTSLTRFLLDTFNGFILYWPFTTAMLFSAVLGMSRFTKRRAVHMIINLVAASGFIGIAVKFSRAFKGQKFANATEVSTYLLVLALGLLLIVIARKLLVKTDDKYPWLGAVIWLMILPYCFVFGTGNLWMKQSLFAGGFTLTACILVWLSLRQSITWFWHIGVLAALLIVPFSVYTLAQKKPYRLPSGLAGQIIPVSIRNGKGGEVYVDKTTAKYLNDFAPFYDQMGHADKRAHLIDMSGMSPFLHYHLDAKIMTVPWLIATEKNSQATFEFILARMDVEDLRTAWIIDAPENRRHLDGAALRAIGLNFPDDYELVLTTRPPLSKKDIHLYRPKPSKDP